MLWGPAPLLLEDVHQLGEAEGPAQSAVAVSYPLHAAAMFTAV